MSTFFTFVVGLVLVDFGGDLVVVEVVDDITCYEDGDVLVEVTEDANGIWIMGIYGPETCEE